MEIFRRVGLTGEPVVITDRGKPSLIIKRYSAAAADPRQRPKGSVLRYDDPQLSLKAAAVIAEEQENKGRILVSAI